jgi:hypothetical protein
MKAWDELRHTEESRSANITRFNDIAMRHLEQFLRKKQIADAEKKATQKN